MRRPGLAAVIAVAAGVAAAVAIGTTATPAPAASSLPQIRHVFIIVLENENESSSFGPGAQSPYLAQTLPSMGVFLPNYYGIGHASLDNYVAMISGQAPDSQTQNDCSTYADFTPTQSTLDANGQATGSGCVYPASAPSVPTIAGQLTAAGDSWKGYMQSMPSACSHPSLGSPDTEQGENPADTYATRHDPFMYFHSIVDDSASCQSHVVNLSALQNDLGSVATTPNYAFITPDVCSDGHDSNCADPSEHGGYSGINDFLSSWVPRITSSPAFKQDGLLAVIFDESASDNTACCGEIAGPNAASPGKAGPGGGKTGAVLVSPFIQGGTSSTTAYNHYSLLASIEDLFGLSRLGMGGVAGLPTFGSDVYNAPPPGSTPPPTTTASTPAQTAATTPSPSAATACTAATRLVIHLPSVVRRLTGVKVLVAGHRAHVSRGKHPTATLSLRGLPAGSATVTITGRRHGKRYRSSRRAHTC